MFWIYCANDHTKIKCKLLFVHIWIHNIDFLIKYFLISPKKYPFLLFPYFFNHNKYWNLIKKKKKKKSNTSKKNDGGHSCSQGSNNQVPKRTWPVVTEMASSAQFFGFTRLLLGCDFEDGSGCQHSLHICSFYEPGFYSFLWIFPNFK